MLGFFLFLLLFSIISIALFIDWRRKNNNNNPHKPTHPNAKQGDSSNYMMGDNKDTGGFQ